MADYPCNDCNKHYKTKGGLRRHQKSKHQPSQKNIIDHLQLKGIIEKAAVKLSDDFCFDESVRKAFSLFKISTESSVIWNQSKDIFEKFSGNAEKFFTSFYGFLQPGKPVLFAQISRYQTTLLSTEVANQFLALGPSVEVISASLEYLTGYCFRTVYARLRNSSKHRSLHSQQSMSVLQAGKCNSDAEMPVQRLVDARDRGGLWKVDESGQAIIKVSEMEFLIASFDFQTKIDAESLVSKLLKDLVIRSNFSIICGKADLKIDKEIGKELLHTLFLLYVRVRSHSYATKIKETHKQEKKEGKQKSLRTTIKKRSSTTNLGH